MKILLILLCIAYSFIPVAKAQLLNADFESFSETTAYDELTDIFSSNNQDHLLGLDASVLRVAGLEGSAARLSGQVLFGSFFSPGLVGTQNLLLGPQERMAYSEQPDSVYVVVRYGIEPGDSATILLNFFGNNVSINKNEFRFTGQSNDFVEIGFDISDFSGATDELFWIVASSGIAITNVDSWIEIDEIRLTGVTDQLPNNLFSNWKMTNSISPDDWQSSNILTGPILDINGVSSSTDSQNGSAAVSIVSVPNNQINYLGIGASLVSNGDIRSQVGSGKVIDGGANVNGNNALIGYYKFIPVNGEKAALRVQLKSIGDVILSDELFDLSSTAVYSDFTYVFPVEGADNMVASFISGIDSETGDFSTTGGSELIVDNLSLSVVTSTTGNFGDNQISFNAYVNNQSKLLHLETSENVEKGLISIYNMEGKMVFNEKMLKTNIYSQSLSHLVSGIYVLHLSTLDKRGSIKLYID